MSRCVISDSSGVEITFGNPKHYLVPEVNQRGNWRARYRRVRAQRKRVCEVLQHFRPPALPAVVTFTRLSSGELDDDNLAGACKAIRDEVAAWLGCGDSPRDPVTWRYRQERCQRGRHAVRIEWEGA